MAVIKLLLTFSFENMFCNFIRTNIQWYPSCWSEGSALWRDEIYKRTAQVTKDKRWIFPSVSEIPRTIHGCYSERSCCK